MCVLVGLNRRRGRRRNVRDRWRGAAGVHEQQVRLALPLVHGHFLLEHGFEVLLDFFEWKVRRSQFLPLPAHAFGAVWNVQTTNLCRSCGAPFELIVVVEVGGGEGSFDLN